MPLPKNSKIIVGVCGGIAAYKACELVRLFKKQGHSVRVVMTANAESFVGSLTFHSLSGEPVLRSLREGVSDLSATSHIDLAKWGDLLVIVPATANTMAKLAHGICDDALTTEALAYQGRKVIAPAMNTRMWEAEATQENLKILKARDWKVVGPSSGDLACGETGTGKLSEPEEIFSFCENLFAPGPLAGKKVLITSGPTRAYIDSVRYITNRSSGRMGHALAEAAVEMGAEVVLVTGPVEPRFSRIDRGIVKEVETGQEMLAACLEYLDSSDFVIATAAVADFEMPSVVDGKMRREGFLDLKLVASVDVLAELGKRKRPGQIFMGFAAEAGEGKEQMDKGRSKLQKKNLDLLALNNISRKDIGFDAKDNEVFVLSAKSHEPEMIVKSAKSEVARALLHRMLDSQ